MGFPVGNFEFCTKLTSESHHCSFKENIGSNFSTGCLEGTGSPRVLTPSGSDRTKAVELGPPSGRWRPYRCQPDSILAAYFMVALSAEFCSTVVSQTIGESFCAVIVKNASRHIIVVENLFICLNNIGRLAILMWMGGVHRFGSIRRLNFFLSGGRHVASLHPIKST